MLNPTYTQQMNIWSVSSKYDCGIVLRSKDLEGYVGAPAGGKKLRMI